MQLGILLTSTITPNVKGGNFSANERLEMYRSTLKYYADTIGKKYPILLVENSGFNLEVFQKEFSGCISLETIGFTPSTIASVTNKDDFDNSKGKGYNEFLMIKRGLEQSKSLSQCTHFLKITGRYPMLNICDMANEIEKYGENMLFMGDIKDTKIYETLHIKKDGHWGDSRFFVANIKYYVENMSDSYLWMDDNIYGRYAEDYIFNFYQEHKNEAGFSFRFKRQVRFGGRSGAKGYNEEYNSVRKRIINGIHGIIRLAFPWLWI